MEDHLEGRMVDHLEGQKVGHLVDLKARLVGQRMRVQAL